jgi:hypothetical protein
VENETGPETSSSSIARCHCMGQSWPIRAGASSAIGAELGPSCNADGAQEGASELRFCVLSACSHVRSGIGEGGCSSPECGALPSAATSFVHCPALLLQSV